MNTQTRSHERAPGRITSFEDQPREYEQWIEPLTSFGWKIDWIKDRPTAEARRGRIDSDVVLMDRQWIDKRIDMVGDEWLEDLFYNTAFPATIVLSQYAEPTAIVGALRHGAFEFIQKGDRAGELLFKYRLNKACLRAKQWQQFRRIRHSLLQQSLASLVKNLYVLLKDTFDQPDGAGVWQTVDVYYLDVSPAGTVRLLPMVAAQEELSRPSDAQRSWWLRGDPISPASLPPLYEILAKRRPVAKQSTDDGVLSDGFGNRVRSRLLVPVLRNERPDDAHLNLVGVLWLESPTAGTFQKDDVLLVRQMADCLSDRLSFERSIEQHGLRERERGQHVLFADIARRICSPLQAAQSQIDLLRARLDRKDEMSHEQLTDAAIRVGDDLERAIQQADRLRSEILGGPRSRCPIRLGRLVADTAQYVAEQMGTQPIPVTVPDGEPTVVVDPDGIRVAIGALLRRASAGGDADATLAFDPDERQTVLLRVRFRNPGPTDGASMFDRTPGQSDGLWEVATVARNHGGETRAFVGADGRTEIEFSLPTSPYAADLA